MSNGFEPTEEETDVAAGASTRELDLEDVPSTDIVFECPHCGKSLSIDPRGAGLVLDVTGLIGQYVHGSSSVARSAAGR